MSHWHSAGGVRRLGLGIMLWCAAALAWTQERQVLVLPPAAGATPMSAAIEAQAVYMAAYGSMVESLAYARKINAEAVAIEIQNSIAYVDAYFKRREMNTAWRKKLGLMPDHLMAVKHLEEVVSRRMREQYQDLLKSDVTDGLNWLLRELSGPTQACRYLPPEQRLSHSTYDTKLNPKDLELINLTDGGPQGSQMVFRLGTPRPLETRWPLGLRAPEFANARAEFEAARDDALAQAQADKGPVSPDASARLMQSVNSLLVSLESAYPSARRADPSEFLTYYASKQYLRALASGVHRVLTTSDRSMFSGGYRFAGETVMDLIEHMYEHGLLFAKPQPGGEGVYRKVFEGLRVMYLAVGSADGVSGERKAAPAAAAPTK